jgi:anti-sigma regulatory factor (Ser/Thr protein kinase)
MNKKRDIHQYILDNVESHSYDIAMVLSSHFHISRQRAHFYLARAVRDGFLIKTGLTRGTRYFLVNGSHIKFEEPIRKGLAEDLIWTKYVKPMLARYQENIRNICFYGFTEMYNNAIDHSRGKNIYVEVRIKDNQLRIDIIDDGIGIFKKIQQSLGLSSMKESILHLSKGKFTTDPEKHSGQGIFFTSRMFDSFSIFSNDMYYTFQNREWFLSPEKESEIKNGTLVRMIISLEAKQTAKQIFDAYADADLEIGFSKTNVAVALSSDPNDPHVSRSQAKRLLMGLDKFETIVLDFKSVPMVGQAFVDEVFRVFQNEYPTKEILYTNASREVRQAIQLYAPQARYLK